MRCLKIEETKIFKIINLLIKEQINITKKTDFI